MVQDITWTGAVLTESDIIAKLMHEDTSWTTFTPTLTQSATVSKTGAARYGRAARLIYGGASLVCSSSGTAANNVVVGLPVAAVTTGQAVIGQALIFDTSASLFYQGILVLSSATTAVINPGAGLGGYLGSFQFTAALASGDNVQYYFTYESTS